MRSFTLSVAAATLITTQAHAQVETPADEARSATGACLAALIDKAPVADIDGDNVVIRRGQDPVSCTVRVTAGEPVVVRDAVLRAITRRSEAFSLARSKWDPAEFASRETFCTIPSRRNVMAIVSTAKPGAPVVLSVIVFEADKRDPRCDQDLGLQTIAAAPPAPSATPQAPAADEPTRIAPPPPKPEKKKGWLPRIPGFGPKT